jgi:hypothetical protein
LNGCALTVTCELSLRTLHFLQTRSDYAVWENWSMKFQLPAWSMLVIVNGIGLSVLGFYSSSGAAPQGGQPPFANAVEQRNEMIRELREIKELLKEQNAMLRGTTKTDVSEKPKR